MANELDNAVAQVAVLLDEIATFTKVHTEEPDSIFTDVEVAVLMSSGEGGLTKHGAAGERHYLTLRTYMPRGTGARAIKTEKTIRQVWNSVKAKFRDNADLNDTAISSIVQTYECGYQEIGGVTCRTMDITLMAWVNTS